MNKGTLIKNGIDFSNGGGSSSVSIDYGNIDEFNTWSETAKDGEIFVRTDDNESSGGGGGSNVAKDILYNNSLTQLDATNVQDAIDKVFQSVSDGKILIADAITDKGIETSATDTFAIMAEHIEQISGGGKVADIDIIDMQYTYKTNYNRDTFDIPLKNVEGVDKIIIHTYKNYPARYECTAQLWFTSDDIIIDYDEVLNENETQYKEWSYYTFTVNRDVTPNDYFIWRNLDHNSASEFRAVIAYIKCSGSGSGGNKELKTLATDVKLTDSSSDVHNIDITGMGVTDADKVILKLKQVHTTTGGNSYDLNYKISISGNTLTITHGELTGTSYVIVDVLYF